MLSIPQIRNLVYAGAYERLTDRVLSGGRSGNLALRLRLTAPNAAAPSAIGLALQRVCELSYAPPPFAAELASQLMAMQREDGFFAGSAEDEVPQPTDDAMTLKPAAGGEASIAATAIVARSLCDFQRQRAEAGLAPDPMLASSIARAMFALSRAQREDGAIAADPVEDAVVLWQLGASSAFRGSIRFPDFRESVESQGAAATPPDLMRLAHSMAA